MFMQLRLLTKKLRILRYNFEFSSGFKKESQCQTRFMEISKVEGLFLTTR
jgi:hypothetical protein